MFEIHLLKFTEFPKDVTKVILVSLSIILQMSHISFLQRNGTLNEVSTIYTGHSSMEEFGYLDKLNGLDHLPYWLDSPCNKIRASEGSFFPPRKYTHSDVVHVYDKDLCRIYPLHFHGMTSKNGIEAGIYLPPEDIFDLPEKQPDNKCYCGENNETCPAKGLQNIAPCQFGKCQTF